MTIPGVSTHARERMAERFGRDLTTSEWLAIVSSILEGRALLSIRENGSEMYLVTVGQVPMRIVWVPKRALIVTVMDPSEMLSLRHAANVKRAKLPAAQVVTGGYLRGRKLKTRTVWRHD